MHDSSGLFSSIINEEVPQILRSYNTPIYEWREAEQHVSPDTLSGYFYQFYIRADILKVNFVLHETPSKIKIFQNQNTIVGQA